MGNAVGGLRDSFYQSLRREYRMEGDASFLYRYFWEKAVTELLEEYFPRLRCPVRLENSGQIRERLRETAGELQMTDRQRERLDFWEALWINNARRQAELISDRDYSLWLIEYLAEHDLYYRDREGRLWLGQLLREAPQIEEPPPEPGKRKQKRKTKNSPAQISQTLGALARQLREDPETAARLAGLKEGEEGYLSWLTARLERMALHIRIKNWLQNSGYPLTGDGETAVKPSPKKPQKQDLSLRMLEAYLDSGQGGGLFGPEQGGGEASGGWRLTEDGFCLPDEEAVEALQRALEQREDTCFYIPLGLDLHSGCVFFLAGKEIYARAYQEEVRKWKQYYRRMEEEYRLAQEAYARAVETNKRAKLPSYDSKELKAACDRRRKACDAARKGFERAEKVMEVYEAAPARLCYDYLRLDRGHLKQFEENPAGAFRLRPVFHLRAKEGSFQTVLRKFIAYCKGEWERSPREAVPRGAVSEFNQDGPAGIPKSFLWAFEGKSREAEESFREIRNRPPEDPSLPRE